MCTLPNASYCQQVRETELLLCAMQKRTGIDLITHSLRQWCPSTDGATGVIRALVEQPLPSPEAPNRSGNPATWAP
jgi:hypothetical protein